MKNLFIKVLLFVTLFVGLYSFNGTEKKNGKFVYGLFVQRVTPASGTTVNLVQLKQDVLVMVDVGATVATLNVPFPSTPADQQLLGITTRAAITNLNILATGGISITAPINTLPAGNAAWYIYNEASNRWFRFN